MAIPDIGTVETRAFDCGCEATLFAESAVVGVNPCADHEDRLTAIR